MISREKQGWWTVLFVPSIIVLPLSSIYDTTFVSNVPFLTTYVSYNTLSLDILPCSHVYQFNNIQHPYLHTF